MLPPGDHNPGDGQVVSMVNTCKPVVKIVMRNEPKWLTGSDQKVRGSEGGLSGTAPWTVHSPVDSGHLTSHMLELRNVGTSYTSRRSLGDGEWAGCEAGRSVCGIEMSEEANAAL
jgi:hypothetical protein